MKKMCIAYGSLSQIQRNRISSQIIEDKDEIGSLKSSHFPIIEREINSIIECRIFLYNFLGPHF